MKKVSSAIAPPISLGSPKGIAIAPTAQIAARIIVTDKIENLITVSLIIYLSLVFFLCHNFN
jgi:glutamine phosphoribosylpyrophosphate amidotransferase